MSYDSKQINKKRKTFIKSVVNEITKRFRIENVFLSIAIEFLNIDMFQFTQSIL